MKKIISWGVYFLICATVIAVAIGSGKKHGHCIQCEIAFDGKNHENDKFADQWLYGN